MRLGASTVPTDTDRLRLRTEVEGEFANATRGISVNNFLVVTDSARRLRRQLLQFSWFVSFDLVFLGDFSTDAGADLVISVTSTLEEPDFVAGIQAAAPNITNYEVYGVILATRRPTNIPTLHPAGEGHSTVMPTTLTKQDSGTAGAQNTGAIGAVLGAVGIALVLIGIGTKPTRIDAK